MEELRVRDSKLIATMRTDQTGAESGCRMKKHARTRWSAFYIMCDVHGSECSQQLKN